MRFPSLFRSKGKSDRSAPATPATAAARTAPSISSALTVEAPSEPEWASPVGAPESAAAQAESVSLVDSDNPTAASESAPLDNEVEPVKPAEAPGSDPDSDPDDDVGNWLRRANEAREAGHTVGCRAILEVAAQRFPQAGTVRQDLARLAEADRDWPEAERWWCEFAAVNPAAWWAVPHIVHVLHMQERTADAEALLSDALERFPKEVALFTHHARMAEMRRDWPEVGARWAEVAERFPDMWEGFAGQARALREQGRPDQVLALLQGAEKRFPGVTGPLDEMARVAESMRDWPAAERWWQESVTLDPRPSWGHIGLATALREQGRMPEAEAVLIEQFERTPQELGLFIEYARFAERSADWPEAENRWQVVQNRFPHRWEGFGGLSRALSELGKLDEARTMLTTAVERFPGQTAPFEALAFLAQRRGDWVDAEHWWRSSLMLNSKTWQTHTWLALTLREQQRFAEATGVLLDASEQFTHDPEALAVFVEHLSRPGVSLPTQDFERLATLIGHHASQPAASNAILLANALIARERKDWNVYRRRLAELSEKAPDDRRVRVLLTEANELATEPDQSASLRTPLHGDQDLDHTQLLLSFESLGGGRGTRQDNGRGGGCEFGFVQRQFGAESLSLLRWASIEPDDLIRGLTEKFAQLGEVNSIELQEQSAYDWRVLEKNYCIPRSRDNPELRWVYDTKIIGDLVTICVPVPGYAVAQEGQHRDTEILECGVTLVVGDVPVH